MFLRLGLAAVTDEFSPDLDVALDAMAALGMTGAELRVIGAANVIDLTDVEIDRVRARVESRGLRVLSIASPVLKCALPDAPPVDPRIQQDQFGARFTFADQPRLARRAFELARRSGASMVRVFSYWRTVNPDACFDRVVSALRELADEAANADLILAVENEHACHIATGAESARLLAALDHPACRLIWDPANALVAGEVPFPDGYRHLPVARIAHVHAKDGAMVNGRVEWGPIGDMAVGWRAQIDALIEDGYRGYVSLETHWRGPNGDKLEASRICGERLRAMLSA